MEDDQSERESAALGQPDPVFVPFGGLEQEEGQPLVSEIGRKEEGEGQPGDGQSSSEREDTDSEEEHIRFEDEPEVEESKGKEEGQDEDEEDAAAADDVDDGFGLEANVRPRMKKRKPDMPPPSAPLLTEEREARSDDEDVSVLFDVLPLCPAGADCYRRDNRLHASSYRHDE